MCGFSTHFVSTLCLLELVIDAFVTATVGAAL